MDNIKNTLPGMEYKNPILSGKPVKKVSPTEKKVVIEQNREQISMNEINSIKSYLKEKGFAFEINVLKYIKISFVTKATARGIFSNLLGKKYEEGNLVSGDGEIIYYFDKKNIPQVKNENAA